MNGVVRPSSQAGFASILSLVLAALITLVLVMTYLRTSVSPAARKEQVQGTVDRFNAQARRLEEHQKQHFEEIERQAGEPSADPQ